MRLFFFFLSFLFPSYILSGKKKRFPREVNFYVERVQFVYCFDFFEGNFRTERRCLPSQVLPQTSLTKWHLRGISKWT